MNRKQRRATGATPAPFAAALAAHQAGNLPRAEALYRRILATTPDHADTLNLLGALCAAAGRHAEALQWLAEASIAAPDNPAVHYNLAGVHNALNQAAPAMAAYRRTLALAPGHQAAWNNLGLLLAQAGNRTEAAAAFRAALNCGADARIHLNLGALLRSDNEPGRAAVQFRRALALQPGFADARAGLADALLANGHPSEALDEAIRALSDADTPATRAAFTTALSAVPAPPETAAAPLRRALEQGWARARDLARPAAHLAWTHARDAPAPGHLAADPLLHALLHAAPVPHPALEAALTTARSALLDQAERDGTNDALLPFWCALAAQCLLNEHVFDPAPGEEDRAAVLATRLAATPDAPVLWLPAVACYRPLPALPARSWPAPVRSLLARAVEEPRAEQLLAPSIPRLTELTNPTSTAVRTQYEENPYPRWTGTAPPDPSLAARLPPGTAEILIAGCGTGQHSVEVARSLPAARILAVDLSLSSLAYARRSSADLRNIEYAQADLLHLPTLGRSFDMVQASGVLHHLADPGEGWRALLAVLKPGGSMFVGLYSALARQDVAAARTLIAGHALQPTPAGIRAARRLLRSSPLAASSDFASTSGCRDLLFHVQEHCLSLPWIADFLRAHGLLFDGFDLPPAVHAAYRSRFPDDPAALDLARWDRFEHDAPGTFAGMYQFWLRKPA